MGLFFFISVVIGNFFIDESPRHLLANNKIDEAKGILKKITEINKRPEF